MNVDGLMMIHGGFMMIMMAGSRDDTCYWRWVVVCDAEFWWFILVNKDQERQTLINYCWSWSIFKRICSGGCLVFCLRCHCHYHTWFASRFLLCCVAVSQLDSSIIQFVTRSLAPSPDYLHQNSMVCIIAVSTKNALFPYKNHFLMVFFGPDCLMHVSRQHVASWKLFVATPSCGYHGSTTTWDGSVQRGDDRALRWLDCQTS